MEKIKAIESSLMEVIKMLKAHAKETMKGKLGALVSGEKIPYDDELPDDMPEGEDEPESELEKKVEEAIGGAEMPAPEEGQEGETMGEEPEEPKQDKDVIPPRRFLPRMNSSPAPSPAPMAEKKQRGRPKKAY